MNTRHPSSFAGTAFDPMQMRHARFLDAQAAFGLTSGLRMDAGTGGGAGAGGAGAGAGAGGDGGGAGGAGGAGAGAGGDGGAGNGGQGGGAGSSVPEGYAVDEQGRSLGYPKDKSTTAMTDPEQAAYWRHQAQKHEGRYKNLTGNRSFDETKTALEEHEKFKREQQTPAEQALADAREEGRKAATATANNTAAKAIFEGALRGGGVADADITDLVESLNVGRYINDKGDIDTAGLTTFASRFTSGTGNQQQERQRNFGAGQRGEGQGQAGAQGKAQLERRFPKQQQNQT